MNKISYLLMNPFSTLTLEDKILIKKLGRPLPDLEITQTQKASTSSPSSFKGRVRKFNWNVYLKNNWICGCDQKNAFFCFVCVLFGGDSTWTMHGITDLVHIYEKIKSHENSKLHINNIFSFSLVGQSNIMTQLSLAHRQNIIEHNQEVDKNRYILNILINCIRFCGALELAGHDETDESKNKGVFRELIDFSSQLDTDLKEHFNKAKVFKGTSKTIQNELLDCMLDVYHEEVTKEIKKTNYVAVIADETTDVANEFQLVFILRYIVSNKPVERFWKFLNPPGHNASSIANCILNEIDPLISDTPNKLIAQSYDGASVMSGGVNRVQKIIHDKYSYANYVHCYAHHINRIMSNAASNNASVRIFFAHLTGMCSFFSTSPQRTKLLDDIAHRRLPRSSQKRLNFQSRGVYTVYEYRNELIHVMDILENDKNIKLNSTIEQAGAYKLRLQNRDFIFWLTIFHKIMPHVELIFKQLQTINTDPNKAKQDLQNFENAIQKIRDEMDITIDQLDSEFLENEVELVPQKKRRYSQSDLSVSTNKKIEALEVCDSIIQQIKARFTFTGHLIATALLMKEHFVEYQKIFPEKLLSDTIKVYPFLEKNRLKIELQVLYEREELQTISEAVTLLSLLSQEDMRDTFQETIKLLEVLVTIPMSTSEAERCFSILERIKTFLLKSKKEERLSALGMLSAEKVFLNNIKDFNERVIELFASKTERGLDFKYCSV
ncbi:unnamed protein product [Psylliodes chrysocephalus]|uniref:DUF4371 domain-containing protein n=1 Tax=Psylliodes chrysocephalus TaxID=3402493 RepID=A0A9P0CYJ3_9CUCU|nr:unnamed protein product [Psylliodes chrysocephala]